MREAFWAHFEKLKKMLLRSRRNRLVWHLFYPPYFMSSPIAISLTVLLVFGLTYTHGSVVNNTLDAGAGSLRQAIADASSGETITFDGVLSGQVIMLASGQLTVDKDLTIDASSLPDGLTIDAGQSSRVFNITAGATVTLDSFTVTGGLSPNGVAGLAGAHGGGIFNEGNLTLSRMEIVGNTSGDGGAGTVGPGGSGGVGGGLYNIGSATIEESTFHSNVAGAGSIGGIMLVDLTLVEAASGPGGSGGAIYNSGAMTIVNSTIHGNSAGRGGSGIQKAAKGGDGGGIFNAGGGTATLYHVTVTENAAGNGGVASSGTTGARGAGGGIVQIGTLLLGNSVIAENDALVGTSDISGAVSDAQGVNFVGDATGATGLGTAGFNFFTGIPNLAPLGENGGPTPTRVPATGSPVTDVLLTEPLPTPFVVDQRGEPRLSNQLVYLGAVEVETVPTAIVTNLDESGAGSLRQAIADATAGAVIGFELGLSGGTITFSSGEILASGKRFALDASNLSDGIILRGNGSRRLFNFSNSAVRLVGVQLTNGRALSESFGERGGAIHVSGTSRLELIQCNLTNNRSDRGGGALYAQGTAAATILVDCVVSGNLVVSDGPAGGIYAGGDLVITGSTVSNNGSRGDGGGIQAFRSCAISYSTISSNNADESEGGGLYLQGSPAVITHSDLASNSTAGRGGALYTTGGVTLTMSHCTVRNNRSNQGNIWLGGPSTVSNCTFTDNSSFSGTAIYLAASTTVQHCTIVNQTRRDTDDETGAIHATTAWTLSNSILANNDSVNVTGIPFTEVGANFTSGDPKLAPLGDYGGSTLTFALQADSPAIDPVGASVTSLTTDQRGFPRLEGSTPDLGAVEFSAARFWKADHDGDGNPYGLEHAIGTNPFGSDAGSPLNPSGALTPDGTMEINFGINAEAAPRTIWILKRSLDMETFDEIYRLDGPANMEHLQPGIQSKLIPPFNPSSIRITDENPPSPRVFYRLDTFFVAP